ncbi:BTAD domain-containing putative transcriptional regulator [Streptomyces sp. NPDC059411]|uniref:AfsR/SARP family transcriptional regulator n=1 Tax=Streptomyces sp. NPDC059411 TaxID=3346825 RepID=UPI0036A7F164
MDSQDVVEFGLLGTLLVRDGDDVVRLRSPRQRTLLAALLLRAGRVLPADELIDLLWGDRPPLKPREALHNHVMRLRQLFGPALAARIRTQAPGYLIKVEEGESDVRRFADLLARGRSAANSGDWSESSRLLREALGLWRGEPLLDVPSPALHLEHHAPLNEARLQAIELRIDADTRLGRDGDLIAELRALCGGHPLRERFHAQLMASLHRSGRQADALAVYRELRRTLTTELGVEPAASVQQLHQRILTEERPCEPVVRPSGGPGCDHTEKPLPRRPRSRRGYHAPALALVLAVLMPTAVAFGTVAFGRTGADATCGPPSSAHRVCFVARTASDAQILTTHTVDLPVLRPVRAGDTLIVSMMLTSTTPGTVNLTDTVGNAYTVVGDVTDARRHRTTILAAVHARPLGTTDRITATYPESSKYHVAVDEFSGIAGPGRQARASGRDDHDITSFSTSADPLPCSAGDLLVGAVGTNTGSAPVFADGWQTLPVLKLSSYRLTTAYRFVTTDGSCAATGTTSAQWEAVVASLHP